MPAVGGVPDAAVIAARRSTSRSRRGVFHEGVKNYEEGPAIAGFPNVSTAQQAVEPVRS